MRAGAGLSVLLRAQEGERDAAEMIHIRCCHFHSCCVPMSASPTNGTLWSGGGGSTKKDYEGSIKTHQNIPRWLHAAVGVHRPLPPSVSPSPLSSRCIWKPNSVRKILNFSPPQPLSGRRGNQFSVWSTVAAPAVGGVARLLEHHCACFCPVLILSALVKWRIYKFNLVSLTAVIVERCVRWAGPLRGSLGVLRLLTGGFLSIFCWQVSYYVGKQCCHQNTVH